MAISNKGTGVIPDSVIAALKGVLGSKYVLCDESSLDRYSIDALTLFSTSNSHPISPRVSAVVMPSTTREVSEIVKLADKNSIPLIPYGAGTGLMGAVTPTRGGIAVHMNRMNLIEQINVGDQNVVVQSGSILGNVNTSLHEHGLMLGHDPYSLPIATVGGAISTNGVGYRASKYGSMGNQVLGLEVVLPSGDILQTRSVEKSSVGPSLASVFVGSEGSFGIITKATLRAFPIPEARIFKTFSFGTFEKGFLALTNIFSSGLKPALIDLTEEPNPRVNTNESDSLKRQPLLYMMFEGHLDEIEVQATHTSTTCLDAGGVDIGPYLTEEYWNTRHDSAYKFKETHIDNINPRPGGQINNIIAYPHLALPISEVLGCHTRCHEIAYSRNLTIRECSLWTHPGLFSVVIEDTGLDDHNLQQAVGEIMDLAHNVGGSMEYVHGVGTKLYQLVDKEIGVGIKVLKAIKKHLDPNNIMNPGKLGL